MRIIAVIHIGRNLTLRLKKLIFKIANTNTEHKKKKNKLLLFSERNSTLASSYFFNAMLILRSGILFETHECDICKIADVDTNVIPPFPAITGPKKNRVTGVTKLKIK